MKQINSVLSPPTQEKLNILVCLKQVPDTGTRIQLRKEGEGIDETGIEWVINPYDEFALEEALRIKERKQDTEVVAISMGPKRVEKALRTALAMGADRACLIETTEQTEEASSSTSKNSVLERKDPTFVALVLAQVIKQEETNTNFIFTGKIGIDENHSATGPMLAEYLHLPHVSFITKLQEVKGDKWLCTRQMETGITEEITLSLPALITVEKGINEPRYPSLPGIMKAKKKILKRIKLSSLNVPSVSKPITIHSYSLPAPPPPPKLISGSAQEQAQKLARILKKILD